MTTASRGPATAARPKRYSAQPHGTNARYVAGCSCLPCCDAHNEYQRGYRGGGGEPRRVDIGPVREHLHALYASGMLRGAVAAASCVSYGVLRVVDGSSPTHGRITTRCLKTTADAILAVRGPVPGDYGAWISARPTKRLIARMRKAGMTLRDIDRLCGWPRGRTGDVVRRQRMVSGRTAKTVLDAAVSAGVAAHPVDRERYTILRTVNGLPPEVVAEVMGISAKTAWRIESEAVA